MKKLNLILLFTAFYRLSPAQNIILTGTVINKHAIPVHYAFVQDKQSNTATFTDSAGMFSLAVEPSAQIIISCNGYNNDTVNVAGNTNLQIALKTNPAAVTGQPSRDVAALQNAFKINNGYYKNPVAFVNTVNTNILRDVVGSRFLFRKWVHGYLIKANGNVVENPAFLFNYDKVEGNLYITENLKSILIADKNTVRFFIVVAPDDQILTFERMTGISDALYSRLISSGSKYKFYKLVTTKFIPLDYKTDGLASTGNKYDEYADEISYYVMDLTNNSFQPLPLKKKAIKQIFSSEGDKLSNFMNAYSSDKIDEDYLKKLGDALNQ